MKRIPRILRNTAGATTIEYAAIASLISVVAITSMETIGATVQSLFGTNPNF
jgi:Flp pilus assembly pilin Flp